MKNDARTLEELVQENDALRNHINELEKLRESDHRRLDFLNCILDSLNEFVTTWDFKGTLTYGNGPFFDRSGFKPEDVIGRPATDIYPPQEIAKLSKLYAQFDGAPDGASAQISSHGLSSSGEWVTFVGEVVKKLDSPIQGYVGTSREVTQYDIDKEAYKESVEAMGTILNGVQDVLLIHDRAGQIIQFNEKMVEIFGLDPVEAVVQPKTADHFYSPEDNSIDLPSIWETVLAGQIILLEYVIKRQTDGKLLDVEVFMRPIRLRGEDNILVSIKDVSDKKRVTDELHRALALAEQLRIRAEAASDAKSKFLANMSHELRTPLNAILGFSELLQEQWYGEINDKQASYVKAIFNSGEHLLQLINDILDLAKVEAGKMEISPSSVDLGQLLSNAFSIVKETAYKRGVELKLDIAAELETQNVWADEVRLKQIVMNLLSNAVKFTPSGGSIKLKAVVKNNEILVGVQDSGIGIKPKDQARIFEEFEQVDNSFSRQQQGTGLGLSLTRKLVELHGGHIWVESEGEGRGSTFRFEIPYVSTDRVSFENESEPLRSGIHKSLAGSEGKMADSNRRTVLVVEDNTTNMKLTTNLLEIGGYKTIPAFSSEEAIKMLETEKPDLILMDISLPGMDGLTATQVLKKNPSTARIPVVALTAHAMKDDERKAIDAGCDAYLLKPIDTRKFYRTISLVIAEGTRS